MTSVTTVGRKAVSTTLVVVNWKTSIGRHRPRSSGTPPFMETAALRTSQVCCSACSAHCDCDCDCDTVIAY